MGATITITHRSVEHADPEAASFVDGFWWTLTTDHPSVPYIESATATEQEAEDYAVGLAVSLGYPEAEVAVTRAVDLMDRKADEDRVKKLIADDVPSPGLL